MSREAMKTALEWDARRKFVMPYKVRDPLREALAQPEQEPYGYFKPEPFGWTDCAETDEGAIPLYEKPPPVCLFQVQQAAIDLAKKNKQLLAAITKTVEKNLHLADGDDCTLIDLVRVLEANGVSV